MKNLLIFLIWIIGISFGSIELSGQSSSAILLNHKWETLMGNHLQFATDSILFDEIKFDIKTGKTSTLTDSSFISTLNQNGDTIVYFEYRVNNDSLMMTFLPSWFRINKAGFLNCSFFDTRFCDFVNRNVTFYSKSYLKRTNKQFQLAYIESKPTDQIYYKLFADGSFIFSTKNKAISYGNYLKKSNNSVTFRSFNGVYTGKLHTKSMDTLKTVLESIKGLKGYLHSSVHPTNDRNNLCISISGKYDTIPISHVPLNYLISTAITFKPMEMYFLGLDGNLEPEPVIIYEKLNVLPPDFYRKRFYNGLYAVSGELSFVKNLKTKDTEIYLYEMKVYNFPAKSDDTIEIGQTIAFISEFQLNPVDIVLLYKRKTVYYRKFLGHRKQVVYNLIVDTLNYKYHYVYEYVDEVKSDNDKIKISRLPYKKVRYPQINSKIAKAVSRLKKNK